INPFFLIKLWMKIYYALYSKNEPIKNLKLIGKNVFIAKQKILDKSKYSTTMINCFYEILLWSLNIISYNLPFFPFLIIKIYLYQLSKSAQLSKFSRNSTSI
ncbi:hypothetical protein BpHYR1_033646, partial [Brachionus plicatilis]